MRVFTVLGPSHSGKSTLVSALAGLEDRAGDKLEVAGVASVHRFAFMDEPWTAIDVVGGPENLWQLGPALAGSDAAVVCVPADADAAVLAAPYLRMVEAAGVPAVLFINGTDRAQSRISEVVGALQAYCRHHICLRQVPMRTGDEIVGAVDLISERAWKYREGQPSALIEIPSDMMDREQGARAELLESLADFDDTLLEQLIEDREPMAGEVYGVASRTLQHGDLIPALIGSALHRNGLTRLMKSLRHEAPGYEVARERLSAGGAALAAGLVADLVKHLGKTVLVRALAPNVAGGAPLGGETIGSLTDIDGKSARANLPPGEIGLTVKSDHVCLGKSFTATASVDLPDWAQPRPPSYRRLITPLHDRDEARLSGALDRLSEIDLGLSVDQDAQSGHIVLSTQGPLHLRRLVQKLSNDFSIEIEEAPVPVALCETVDGATDWHHRHRKQSGGAGQFADVLISVKSEPRGGGFAFSDEVKGGAVPRNYIPAVEAGVREALAEGPGGHEVVDVSVVLKDGKHHSVDSSDFAFRTAGKNAMREALASLGSITLQPILKVHIHVPTVYSGGLVPTISGLKGQVLGFESETDAAGWDLFECLLPMAALDSLYNTLGSATRGTAWYTTDFDHYEKLRKEDAAALRDAQMERA